MVFEENSDLIYQIGLWLSIAIVAAIIILMMFVIMLRIKLIYTRHRREKFLAVWQPILLSTVATEIPELNRPISRIDRLPFFLIWIQCYEDNIGNEAALQRLRILFKQSGMVEKASKMIRKMKARSRLIAIIALGYLREESEWDEIYRIAASPDPFISLVAGHALSHIDKTKAAPAFIKLIEKHPDWPSTKIAKILNELGPENISEPLIQLVLAAPAELQASLIPFLATCKKEIALPVARNLLLQETKDDARIAPCLRVLGTFQDSADLTTIRAYLSHQRWHIRAQAATCLGKTGNEHDEQPLLELLKDKQWWVRYRAAQALACLSSMNPQKLLTYKQSINDNYGQDILTQVIAEIDSNHHA